MPFHLKYIPKKNYVIYFQPFNDTYLPLVGPQIILSQKLSIQNNNHTQQHKYLRGNPFFFEGEKSQDKLRINSLFIKSITINIVYVSRLKKNLSCFSLLSHTNYFSQKRQHFALSFLFSSSRTTLSWLSSFL